MHSFLSSTTAPSSTAVHAHVHGPSATMLFPSSYPSMPLPMQMPAPHLSSSSSFDDTSYDSPTSHSDVDGMIDHMHGHAHPHHHHHQHHNPHHSHYPHHHPLGGTYPASATSTDGSSDSASSSPALSHDDSPTHGVGARSASSIEDLDDAVIAGPLDVTAITAALAATAAISEDDGVAPALFSSSALTTGARITADTTTTTTNNNMIVPPLGSFAPPFPALPNPASTIKTGGGALFDLLPPTSSSATIAAPPLGMSATTTNAAAAAPAQPLSLPRPSLAARSESDFDMSLLNPVALAEHLEPSPIYVVFDLCSFDLRAHRSEDAVHCVLAHLGTNLYVPTAFLVWHPPRAHDVPTGPAGATPAGAATTAGSLPSACPAEVNHLLSLLSTRKASLLALDAAETPGSSSAQVATCLLQMALSPLRSLPTRRPHLLLFSNDVYLSSAVELVRTAGLFHSVVWVHSVSGPCDSLHSACTISIKAAKRERTLVHPNVASAAAMNGNAHATRSVVPGASVGVGAVVPAAHPHGHSNVVVPASHVPPSRGPAAVPQRQVAHPNVHPNVHVHSHSNGTNTSSSSNNGVASRGAPTHLQPHASHLATQLFPVEGSAATHAFTHGTTTMTTRDSATPTTPPSPMVSIPTATTGAPAIPSVPIATLTFDASHMPKERVDRITTAFHRLTVYCEREKIVPRESILKKRLLDSRFTSSLSVEEMIQVCVQVGHACVEGEPPRRTVWPTNRLTGQARKFACVDFQAPQSRLTPEQKQQLMRFLLQNQQPIERGRFGFAQFLAKMGPESIRWLPHGVLVEQVQVLLNEKFLLFRKGKIWLHPDVIAQVAANPDASVATLLANVDAAAAAAAAAGAGGNDTTSADDPSRGSLDDAVADAAEGDDVAIGVSAGVAGHPHSMHSAHHGSSTLVPWTVAHTADSYTGATAAAVSPRLDVARPISATPSSASFGGHVMGDRTPASVSHAMGAAAPALGAYANDPWAYAAPRSALHDPMHVPYRGSGVAGAGAAGAGAGAGAAGVGASSAGPANVRSNAHFASSSNGFTPTASRGGVAAAPAAANAPRYHHHHPQQQYQHHAASNHMKQQQQYPARVAMGATNWSS